MQIINIYLNFKNKNINFKLYCFKFKNYYFKNLIKKNKTN